MNIEIICPLYNAEKYLENLDKSLKKQKNVEIAKISYILTESNDNTEQILKELSAQYSIVKKEDFSHSLSRENIAMKSNADILVFITQDIEIVNDDWLEKLTKPIIEKEAEATFSRQISKYNNIEKYTREKNYPENSYIVEKKSLQTIGMRAFFFSDAASAIKTTIFKDLKGYDAKNLPTNEDQYIAYKLIINDYKIKYCADSVVYHSHNFTLKQLYKRYYDTGIFFKQNSYLDKYGTNKTGGGLAKYILRRAIQEKNIKAILEFLPNMAVRFLGMNIGKKKGNIDENKQFKIMYVVSDLKRVGPSNQTLNIIKNLPIKNECIVITLFKEPKDSMIEEYIKNNIEIKCLNLNRFTFVFRGKKFLHENILNLKVKIVHSYGIKPDYICKKSISNTNATHVITLRNFPKEDIFSRMNLFSAILAYKVHKKVLLNTKYVVACSNSIKEKMKLEYKKDNIVAIQNGVDTEKFTKVDLNTKNSLRKKYNFNLNQKIFISTSSFIPRKRIEETIEAFLNSNVKNKILLLLGTGSEYQRIYNKYSKNKDVVFVGKTDKVCEYLQLADIFVSSSESEGLPNGVIEAISTGLPVILSDIPQHKEILNEVNNCGVCYELGNTNNLKSKMEENYSFEPDITKSNLTMNNMSKKYYDYYMKILNRRR